MREEGLHPGIQGEQIRQLYRQSTTALAAAPLVSGVVALSLWGIIAPSILVGWVLAVFVVTAAKFFLVRRYRSAAPLDSAVAPWGSRYVAGNFISGCVWGAAGILLFPESSYAHQFFLCLMLGGMAAGAVAAYSSVLKAYLAFSLPAFLPMSLRFIVAGGGIDLLVGFTTLAFQILLYMNARMVHEAIRSALRLQFENQGLVDRLAEETRLLTSRNQEYAEEILQRKRAEDAASRRQEYLEAVMKAKPDATITLDEAGRVLEWNPGAERLFGYGDDEARGRFLNELVTDPEHPMATEAAELDERTKGGGAITPRETLRCRKDGEHVNVLLASAPILIAGRPNGSVVSYTDLTEHRQVEAALHQLQRIRSVGALAGGIAHDFNNVLTGVFGNLCLAKIDLAEDHPSYAFLNEAEKSMDRTIRLTKQLLTFAKGGDPVRENVSLFDTIREVTQFDLTGSNVRPVFDSEDGLWIARVDKGQIQQVFSNLVRNADEAMPHGGHLYLSLSNHRVVDGRLLGLEPGRYLKVTVRDEGSGIDVDVLEHVFEPYFTTKQSGHGLGLAMVFSITKRHGGTITVESVTDEGTTFTLYLPVAKTDGSAALDTVGEVAPGELLPPAAGSPNAPPLRVLVMDDEQVIRDVAARMLERGGYSVETAAEGREALAMYRDALDAGRRFDAVLMDCTVPGGAGAGDIIEDLLILDPDVFAIVSSGYTEDPLLANYEEFGFKDRVTKPYVTKNLVSVVHRALCAAPE